MSGDQGVRGYTGFIGSGVHGFRGQEVMGSGGQGVKGSCIMHQATRPPGHQKDIHLAYTNDPSTHANMMGFTSSARKNNMRIVLLEAMQGCRATLGGAHQETLESIISIDS